MNDVRERWNERARASGTSLTGVLFRGLSPSANAAVDAWHSWVIAEVLASRLPAEGAVLDLGCGFGRLARILRSSRPDLHIVGQDIAMTYCQAFRDDVGSAVLAQIEALPFAADAFDGVVMVTSLMYAEPRNARSVVQGVARILKPGGVLLLLDPGRELQALVAAVRPWKASSPTAGTGFRRDQYLSLVTDAGLVAEEKGGNPCLSAALLIPGIGGNSSERLGRGLFRVARHDHRTAGYSAFALHRWILAGKPRGAA